MAALGDIGNKIVKPGIRQKVGRRKKESYPTSWCGHSGEPGKDSADGAIILEGRHVVVDLVAGDSAFFIEREFDIGESSRGLSGPLQIFGTHPLNANGLSNSLRQDYGVVFRSRVAAVRAAVVPCSRMRVNNDVIGRGAKHDGNFAPKRLRILVVGMDMHCSVWVHVGNGHRGADGCMLHEGKVICCGEFFLSAGERGRHIALCGAAFCNLRSGPIGFLTERIVKLFVAGEAFPFTPFRCGGNLLRSLNGLPLGWSDDSYKIPFHDDLRIGKFGFVELADRDERGTERFRMHHASMQHSGKADVRGPGFFCRDFRGDDGVRMRLADDGVGADRLHRRIALDSQSHNACQIASNGDGEFELLIFDQVAVRHGFAAAGKDTVFGNELVFRDVEAF